jgi:threonine dehydratase
VAELAEGGERREAVLATSISERPGTFKEFCRLVGSDINISEFKYRRADNSSAHLFYSVNVGTNEELAKIMERMAGAEFPTIDMSSNDLAKTHLRHLVSVSRVSGFEGVLGFGVSCARVCRDF